MVQIILENKGGDTSYLWDPSAVLLDEMKGIYKRVAASGKEIRIKDHSREIDSVKQRIRQELEEIGGLIGSPDSRGMAIPLSPLFLSEREGLLILIGRGLKNAPVKKPPKSDDSLQKAYDVILRRWVEVGQTIQAYTSLYARSYYDPYLKLYGAFSETAEEVKKRQGKVFIEDINKQLSAYLQAEIVPDIYCRLGETVFHFLIDEFQDTSPIQWQNLLPLIGE